VVKFDSYQKTKIVLVINFVFLFVLIILTPSLIKEGTHWFSEAKVEGFFLTIELLALFIIFRSYDSLMSEKEAEVLSLDAKLRNKEKELLDAFQYLGKVNVQVSMIESVFEKVKAPTTKNQLKEIYSEFLKIVCSITEESNVAIRIINLKTKRTLGEFFNQNGKGKVGKLNIGNVDLISKLESRDNSNLSNYYLFFSRTESFFVKAFVLVPHENKKSEKYDIKKRRFLEAIANQCEIAFLLFNSKYYNLERRLNKKGSK
jgi:hypothetical protein